MGGTSDESVNRMFTLTDSFVAHMIRRYDIFGMVREVWKIYCADLHTSWPQPVSESFYSL